MDQHLAVEVTNSSIRFVTINNGVAQRQFEASIEGKTDSERKSSLSGLFDQNDFLKKEFDNVSLAWCGEKSTLVPNAIFNDSSAQDIFSLCFGKNTPSANIDYNRISELSVINVYDIPDWVKSFFVIKYPLVVIQHAGTHLVRQVLNNNAFKLKATILCFDDYFRLTIVKHNALEFYSSFQYQSFEDIVYHLTFALQQKEMVNDKGSIEIGTSVGSSKDIANKVEESVQRIQELKKMSVLKDSDYLAKSQLLCV